MVACRFPDRLERKPGIRRRLRVQIPLGSFLITDLMFLKDRIDPLKFIFCSLRSNTSMNFVAPNIALFVPAF
jgi:hypothetical protein